MRFGLTFFTFTVVVCLMCGCATSQVDQKLISAKAKVDVISDGLSVTSIVIEPLNVDLVDQLTKFGKPLKDKELSDKLLLEGIHAIEIETIDIPAIAASIGEIVSEEFVWHGQVLKWRDIKQRKIPFGGMIITAEGIPYLIEGGYLSILARSWLVEREDGLFVYLQAMPTWHMPTTLAGLVGQSKNLSQKKVFSDLKLEAVLRDSQAIMLAVKLNPDLSQTGPYDEGRPAVRLGEALMGGPANTSSVLLLVLEANLQSR